MKLIVENTIGNICNIKEEQEKGSKEKSLFIEGIFAQAEKKNRNERVYPKKVLERAISQYVSDYVNSNRAMGELNHRNTFSVDPERACILIKSLDWSGNDVYGKAKVLKTPQGEIVKALLSDGVQLGVSTRGLGTIKEDKNGDSIVDNDFTIAAIDVVSNPSGIDCFVNGVLENVEFYYDNGVLVESTIDEFLKHKRFASIDVIEEDFKKFCDRIIL